MNGTCLAVEVDALVRDYAVRPRGSGSKPGTIRALDGLSFSVSEGLLFGLLGPNGAGKTTTVKILSTVISPSAGTARLFGYDVVKQAHLVRPRIGVAFGGDLGLYWRLSGWNNLVFAGQLYGMGAREASARAREMLDRFGLMDAAHTRVDAYSRGMRQRLHLARCLMHDPVLVFLDEPTSGLDPAAARDVRRLMTEMKRAGKTIFLTTHNMVEADELCDSIAIISRGKLIAMGTPTEIKRLLGAFRVLELRLNACDAPDPEVLARKMRVTRSCVSVEQAHSGTIIRVRYEGVPPVRQILACLGDATVIDIATRENTLEEAYLRLLDECEVRNTP